MASSSARIDIYGQQGLCDGSGVKVSRSMPAILSGSSLTSTDWNNFCDGLDVALKPAATMRKVMMGSMFALPLIFIIFAVTSFASFSSGSSMSSGFTGFIIGVVIMFGGFALLTFVMMSSRNKISTGLRKVCDETSARHPGVSFHVRYETRFWGNGYYYGGGNSGFGNNYYGNHNNVHVQTQEYIEVMVSSNNVTTTHTHTTTVMPTVTAVSAASPTVQAYVVGGVPSAPPKADVVQSAVQVDPEFGLGLGSRQKKSPEERMRELDGMKSLLTEEEYQRKRAEILSDV